MKTLVDDLYNSEGTNSQSDIARVAFATAAVVVAYHASLWTLIGHVGVDTRSARTVIVLALGAALAYAYRHPAFEVSIHDRQVDWIVGLPLIALAVALNASASRVEPHDWVHRVDFLSLPIFVSGITVLLLGLRTLGRQRRAVLFLLLAWPAPYDFLHEHWPSDAGATAVTMVAVLGVAALCMVDGRPSDKWAWLTGAIALTWVTSLAVHRFGVVTEFIAFTATIVAMLAALPRAGLTYRFAVTHEQLPSVRPFRPAVGRAACCVAIATAAMAWLPAIGVS